MKQDWTAKEQAVETARLDAVREIYEARGLEGLLALVPSLKRASRLGVTLAGGDFVGEDEENAILSEYLAHEDSKKLDLAQGFVFERTRTRGIEWVRAKVLGPGQECLPNRVECFELCAASTGSLGTGIPARRGNGAGVLASDESIGS